VLNLDFSRQSEKFLRKLQKGQPKHARQIALKISELRVNPLPSDSVELRGYDYRRVSIGEYRIIYTFDNQTLFLTLIGKRNDDEIYDLLQRKS
jgi:mRNA interferase RelE/StbE